MSILAQLINYTKNPTLETNFNPKNKFWVLLQLSGLSLGLSSISWFFISPILKIVGYKESQHLIAQELADNPSILILISTVIIAPLIEEIVFRGWLRPSFRNLVVAFWLFIGGWVIFTLFPEFTILNSIISVLVGLYWLLSVQKNNMESLIPKQLYRYLYYFAIIWFGLVHFPNFNDNSIWYLAPILVLPQLIAGFTFGFVRMNFGLKWSILAHAFENFVLIIPSLFVAYGTFSIRSQIKDSEQFIPDLIYTLSQLNQVLFFVGLSCYTFVIICSLIFTSTLIYDYYKSIKKENRSSKNL
jgi:uncharacterized protein